MGVGPFKTKYMASPAGVRYRLSSITNNTSYAAPDTEAIKTLETAWTIISKAENSVPVNQPTRCIDYVFHYKKSKAVTVTNGGTMTKFRTGDPTKTSDHLPVFADVKF